MDLAVFLEGDVEPSLFIACEAMWWIEDFHEVFLHVQYAECESEMGPSPQSCQLRFPRPLVRVIDRNQDGAEVYIRREH